MSGNSSESINVTRFGPDGRVATVDVFAHDDLAGVWECVDAAPVEPPHDVLEWSRRWSAAMAAKDLEGVLQEALTCGRTAVVDARVDAAEQCFPMIPAGAAALDLVEFEDGVDEQEKVAAA